MLLALHRPLNIRKGLPWIFRRLPFVTSSPTEAASLTGYASPKSAAYNLKRSPKITEYNRSIGEAAEWSDLPGWVILMDAMAAERSVAVLVTEETTEEDGRKHKRQCKEVVKEKDHYARLKSIDLAFKLTGGFPEAAAKVKVETTVDVRNAPLVTSEMGQLTGQALLDSLMKRARQIVNGTLPQEEATIDP